MSALLLGAFMAQLRMFASKPEAVVRDLTLIVDSVSARAVVVVCGFVQSQHLPACAVLLWLLMGKVEARQFGQAASAAEA